MIPMSKHALSEKQLEIIRNILIPYAGKIERVGIFGSRATGTARENSDIDMVLYGEIDEEDIDRIWTLFYESILAIKVDIVAYNLVAYSPLKRHIDSNVKILFTQSDLQAT